MDRCETFSFSLQQSLSNSLGDFNGNFLGDILLHQFLLEINHNLSKIFLSDLLVPDNILELTDPLIKEGVCLFIIFILVAIQKPSYLLITFRHVNV
jgi:hypothetical protein